MTYAWPICLALILPSVFGVFPAYAETPEEFIAAAIGEDFAGSNDLRGRVYYTDGRYYVGEAGGCGCGPYWRAIAGFNDSPIFVVSDYQIIGSTMSSRAMAEVRVRYRVLADGIGDNSDRRILPLPQPQLVEATFRVRLKKGEWLWVDPPEKPYVGWQAAREAMQKQVDGHLDAIKSIENDQVDPKWKEELVSRQNLKAKYQRQLDALDSLRPMLSKAQP